MPGMGGRRCFAGARVTSRAGRVRFRRDRTGPRHCGDRRAYLQARRWATGQACRGRTAGTAAAVVPQDRTALEQLLLDRNVVLRGPNARPDRYGRLAALAFAGDASNSIQGQLVDQGAAVFSGDVADSDNKDCAMELLEREAAARRARRGVWADGAAIKNTERPGDILPWIGQFVVAEGKIASVREASGTIYINFGRRWTEGFAVTISRRMIRRFDAWGIALKTLENRTVRVRGFVEQRTGPRIEALGPGQIELVGDDR